MANIDLKRKDEIRQGLSGRLLEIFDDLWAATEDPVPDEILFAANDQHASEILAKENAEAWRKADRMEQRKELSYFKYRNSHPDLTLQDKKAIIGVFYSCDEPESLLGKNPSDLLAMAGAPAKKGS